MNIISIWIISFCFLSPYTMPMHICNVPIPAHKYILFVSLVYNLHVTWCVLFTTKADVAKCKRGSIYASSSYFSSTIFFFYFRLTSREFYFLFSPAPVKDKCSICNEGFRFNPELWSAGWLCLREGDLQRKDSYLLGHPISPSSRQTKTKKIGL